MTLWLTFAPPISTASAVDTAPFKSAGGLSVFIGIVPAEIVKGYASQNMHGGPPRGRHEYHVMAAIFDTATGARISDATVTARVAGLGLAGSNEKLEPMEIAGAMTYGNFFDLPGRDLYTVRLEIRRAGSQRPVVVEFKYDHRNE